MRDDDWLAVSAAALVVGAMSLLAASALTVSGSDPAQTLLAAREQGGQWMVVAYAYFFASVGLVLGLPTLLAAAPERGRYWVRWAAALLALGSVGIAGLASLLVLLRSLVVVDAISAGGLERVGEEPTLLVFLFGWVGAFYLGELLLAVGLLRAGATAVPRWVPLLLLVHVASMPLSSVGPDWTSKVTVLLLVAPLCGLGISVAQRQR